MSEILTRLRGYNPPDRTHDSERIIAQDISDAADEIERLRLALETATRERDDIAAWAESWMKRVAAAERERDEARRHAEEQLADVLRLRFLGIEFASQYGDRALACKYDNSCDDSGREPACIPCAFRRALGLMGVN